MTKLEEFNIVITGVGGQGLVTLLQIMAETALASGLEVRTSELHGLSQRGGSVEVHIRFGQKIYSPLVAKGKADFILALEAQESLRALYFANPRTTFLINNQITPIPLQKSLASSEIAKSLQKVIKKVVVVDAAGLCQKELGTAVVSGVYLLSLASFQGLIPLKPEAVLPAIKKVIPTQYFDINFKAFQLAKKYDRN
jgi:indolepyruvate ferredoxin oxidoreductase beta subunit